MGTVFAPIEDVELYLFVVGALIMMATYIWQFRNVSGAKQQVYLEVCKICWLVLLLLLNKSTELQEKIVWFRFVDMVSLLTPFFWFWLIWRISRPMKALPIVIKYGYLGMIVLSALLLLTNSWYGLIWQNFWLDEQKFIGVPGPLEWIESVSWMLSLVTLLVSFHWVFISKGLHRKQALWFAAAGVITLSGVVVDAAFSIHSMLFCTLLTAACMTWCFYRWRNYNIFSLAQQSVIRTMMDGLVVVDEYGYITDLNPAAKEILVGLPISLDSKFETLVQAWPVLGESSETGKKEVETARDYSSGRRFYQIYKTPLEARGQCLGLVILLKDITWQKQEQAQILEQKKTVTIMEEKENLARELHDDLCQVLGYINVQSQAAAKFVSDGKIEQTIFTTNHVVTAAQRAYDHVRDYIRGVQVQKELATGLAAALREYIRRLRIEYGLDVEANLPLKCDQPLETGRSMQLLRIVQEALANVRKHAKADHVRLTMLVETTRIQIIISDDGKGFEIAACPLGTGFGLTTMQDRAEKAGGKLEIISSPGEGTQVIVEIPRGEVVCI